MGYVPGVQPDLTFNAPTTGGVALGVITEGFAEFIDEVPFGTPPTPENVRLVQLLALDSFQEGVVVAGDSSLGYTYNHSDGSSNLRRIAARALRSPQVLSPFNLNPDDFPFGTVQPNGGIYWHPEYLDEADKPADRVGFEWLDQPGVPGSMRVIEPSDVEVTLTVIGTNYDSSLPGSIAWESYFVAQSGDAVAFTTDVDPTPDADLLTAWTDLYVGSTIFHTTDEAEVGNTLTLSLFDYLDDLYRCLLWARALPLSEATLEPLMPSDVTAIGATLAYGNRFNVDSIVWHFQPPPYRWVTPTKPGIRITARDGDGVFSGGRRVYPRPRSNRLAGRQP